MSEKLIPFDFVEFVKDPSRLRVDQYGGTFVPAIWAEPVRCCVAAMERLADGGSISDMYAPHEFYKLRLAAKTRKVRVRMFDYGQGRAGSVSSDISSIAGPTTLGGQRWISDPVEVEVQE